MARKVPKGTIRKGIRVVNGQPKVVTTRKPRGIAHKLIDQALKQLGK